MIVGTFNKEKMKTRVEKEFGKGELSNEILKTMEQIDGLEVNDYCWENYVKGEYVGIIVSDDNSLNGIYVNLNDCDLYPCGKSKYN